MVSPRRQGTIQALALNHIARETEIKGWRREKKLALIHTDNPTWEDLAEGWGGPAVMKVTAKAGSSPG
jgi:hypothetical protein